MGAEASESDVSTQGSSQQSAGSPKNSPTINVSHHPLRASSPIPLTDPGTKKNAACTFRAPTPSEETALSRALVDSIKDLLHDGFAVSLEGFGILSPETAATERTFINGSEQLRRLEESITVSFEKSREITAYHRERFPRLIETKDLTPAVHAALPAEIGVLMAAREVRHRIVESIRKIRRSVIEHGYSDALAPLGDFYALHNRQGETLNDRFAGADIFIKPRFSLRTKVSDAHRLDRPLLENGWEIIAAAFGAPIETLKIDLPRELKSLGYTLSPADESNFLTIKSIDVAVFKTGEIDGRPILLYVTDGLRKLARKGGTTGGNELTFQLSVSSPEKRGGKLAVPGWPTRALTLGWLLLISSRSRTLKPAIGFSADLPLIPDCDTDMCAIFSTTYRPIQNPQLDIEGEFSYMNLLGITASEATLAQECGGEHLLTLLAHRGLDQITKPTRSSVIARSVIEPQPLRS